MPDDQTPDKPEDNCPSLYGVVTIGERGQIVIPADARKALALNPGDRLVVLEHPFNEEGLVIFKAQQIESIVQRTLAGLTRLREEMPE